MSWNTVFCRSWRLRRRLEPAITKTLEARIGVDYATASCREDVVYTPRRQNEHNANIGSLSRRHEALQKVKRIFIRKEAPEAGWLRPETHCAPAIFFENEVRLEAPITNRSGA